MLEAKQIWWWVQPLLLPCACNRWVAWWSLVMAPQRSCPRTCRSCCGAREQISVRDLSASGDDAIRLSYRSTSLFHDTQAVFMCYKHECCSVNDTFLRCPGFAKREKQETSVDMIYPCHGLAKEPRLKIFYFGVVETPSVDRVYH